MNKPTTIRMSEQARADAAAIRRYYGLRGLTATILFALRETARRADTLTDTHTDTTTPPASK